jgi:hypothetical protein
VLFFAFTLLLEGFVLILRFSGLRALMFIGAGALGCLLFIVMVFSLLLFLGLA